MQVCIEHIGHEEALRAAQCDDRNGCTSEQQCVLVSRATDGQELSWTMEDEGFGRRMQSYYDYLLYTSGATTLRGNGGESGDESTAIA